MMDNAWLEYARRQTMALEGLAKHAQRIADSWETLADNWRKVGDYYDSLPRWYTTISDDQESN